MNSQSWPKCVLNKEYAHRFIRSTYGIPTKIGIGLGDGQDLAFNISERFRSTVGSFGRNEIRLIYFDPNCALAPPAPGSVVSFEWLSKKRLGKFGHVAVVDQVYFDSETVARVYVIQQNGAKREVSEDCRDYYVFERDLDNLWHWTKRQADPGCLPEMITSNYVGRVTMAPPSSCKII